MERRGFIQGLFGGLTAAGLIVAAKPEEIEAFASPLTHGQPLLLDKPEPKHVGLGQHLYNEHGQLVAIVTEVNLVSQPIEVTSFDGSYDTYVSGLRDFEIRATGMGSIHWLGQHQGLALEGIPRSIPRRSRR
jgi:hypothetical protein